MQDILKYSVSNFKNIRNVSFEIKPLTFLFGANSSGKSSILKSMLFLQKNIIPFPFDETTSNIEEATTNLDEFTDLGEAKDVINSTSEGNKISFELEFLKEENVQTEFSLNDEEKELWELEEKPKQEVFFNTGFEFTLKTDSGLSLSKVSLEDLYNHHSIKFWPQLSEPDPKNHFQHPFPKCQINFFKEKEYNAVLKILLSQEDPIQPPLPFVGSGLSFQHLNYKNLKTSLRKFSDGLEKQPKDNFFEDALKFYYYFIELFPDIVRSNFLSSLLHLKSLRLPPKRSYMLQRNRFHQSDYFGFLDKLFNQDYLYSTHGLNIDKNSKFEKSKLKGMPELFKNLRSGRDILNYYLKDFFQLASEFYIKKNGEMAYPRIKLLDGKGSCPLSESSSGLIQLLPILITSIFESGTILIEQPELHLHPGLQTKLAEFLSQWSAKGKKYIIETHSEHIIRKIQVLIAQNKLDRSLVKVYYISNDKRRKNQIREMKIDKKGFFEGAWPDNFFDESYNLSKDLLFSRSN